MYVQGIGVADGGRGSVCRSDGEDARRGKCGEVSKTGLNNSVIQRIFIKGLYVPDTVLGVGDSLVNNSCF